MNAGNAKYITIYEWMNDLDLSSVEKIAYALVYSFCKKGECFNGKNSYLQEWLGCSSKHTTIGVMRSLEEKGLIVREQQMVNGKATNVYMLGAEIAPKGCKKCTGGVQKLHERGAEIAPNNNNDINNDNNLTLTTHVREKIEVIKKWLTDNALGTESLAIRNKLIQGACPIEEIVKKLEPYVEQYYTEQLEQGKGEIEKRGHTDILSHFAYRLPAYICKEKDQEETKIQPIATKKNGNFDKADFLAKLNS